MAGLPPKLADQFGYPPRLMRLSRVASYVDVSPSTFLRMVEEGMMPKPITHKGIRWWDRNDIEACCDDLKEGPINTYDKVMGLK
jgi:predicted DNA-binding transcriptional regulator AlpA